MENLHQIIFSENVCRQFSEEVLQQGNQENLKSVCNFLNSLDIEIAFSSMRMFFNIDDILKFDFDHCAEFNTFSVKVQNNININNYSKFIIFIFKRKLNIFSALQQICDYNYDHKGKNICIKVKK